MKFTMMKSVLIMSALVLSIGAAQAKSKTKTKNRQAPKMSREDARELCLTTKGAGVEKKELRKCVTKAMRSGKV